MIWVHVVARDEWERQWWIGASGGDTLEQAMRAAMRLAESDGHKVGPWNVLPFRPYPRRVEVAA